MQDGATSHRTVEVFKALFLVYSIRVIGLGYPKFAKRDMEYPPHSPDLNPYDFYLWGYIKEKLRDAIRDIVRTVDEAKIQRFYTSFKRRIEIYSTSNGGHLDGIVF